MCAARVCFMQHGCRRMVLSVGLFTLINCQRLPHIDAVLQVWEMYKKAEASFWTAEELDLAHDFKVGAAIIMMCSCCVPQLATLPERRLGVRSRCYHTARCGMSKHSYSGVHRRSVHHRPGV